MSGDDDIVFSCSTRPKSNWTDSERLSALGHYAILDTPPERAFDDLARLAADICETPIAIVSLVDEARQWFKAEIGLGISETDLSNSVCAHAIAQDEAVFVVPDLTADPRFAQMGIVTGPPNIRFYAGALIVTQDGLPLGTICVLDRVPRPEGLDSKQKRSLEALARQVMTQMTLGRALAERLEGDEALRRVSERAQASATENAAILNQLAEGVIVTDLEGRIVFVNDAAERLHGVKSLNVPPERYTSTYHLFTVDGHPYPPGDLPLARTVRNAETVIDAHWRIRRPDGSEILAIGSAHPIYAKDGARFGSVLTLRDDTARHETERSLRESETRLRALADNLPSGWTFQLSMTRDGKDRRFLYASQSCARLLGATAPEIMANAALPYSLVAQEHRQGLIDAEAAALRDLSQLDIEVPFLRADTGEECWSRIVSAPRKTEDGRIVWDGLQIDTTDLQRRSAEFKTLADNMPALCWMAYADGHIFWYNRRWYDYSGTTPEDQEGWGWARLHDPAMLDTVTAKWRHSLASGEPFAMTFPLRGVDGIYRPFLTRIVPIRDTSGAIVRWFGTNVDVSTEVAARDALRDSEAKFRAFAESMPQMLWSTRPDGFHDYYNPQWYAFTGVPEGSTDGEAWNGMFHPEDQDRAWARWRHSLATGDTYEIEYRLRHRSGQYRWVLGRAAPIRNEAGEIVRWMGSCTDIDDIAAARRLQGELREELARQVADRTRERDRIWELSEDLLVTADFEGRTLAANPAWTAALGFDHETILETPYSKIVHPDDFPAVMAELAALRKTGRPIRFENRVKTADGGWRWMSWRLSLDPSGLVLHGVGRDITEARERDEALKNAESALRQAQKMEAVGQLTGGIAHDFNNLLTIVVGNLEMLDRQLPEDAGRMRRNAENALKGANRAAALTQRLLAFSRRQPLAPKPIDLNKLVSGMSELMHRTLGEPIAVETVLAGGLWRIEVDPNQLENALLNLAVNARDAMPDGGKLTIETANAHLDEAYAFGQAEVQPGQYVVICVSDTGQGMEKAVLDRVFEPFFTTKEVGQGTGLGLSQVYGFVKQSSGHVKVYSEPGEGTTVKLYFPRHLSDQDEAEPELRAPVPEGHSEEIILVVEDDDDVRAYSVEALRELGYKVIEAHDGPAALRLLERQPKVDLLFSDVILPGGMTGRDLSEVALRMKPDLKILFTTGYARNAIVHQGRLKPGVELIGKPFTYAALAAKIRDVLDG